MTELILKAEPLSVDAFVPFGNVIEVEGREFRWINAHTCRRFDDLAQVDVEEAGGRVLISIFEASPQPLPFAVCMLERHPLSSQAFYPLENRPFLVVVAPPNPQPMARDLRAFVSSGKQGVNYHRGVWHHSLVALEQTSRFLVVDRGGEGDNCDEAVLDSSTRVSVALG